MKFRITRTSVWGDYKDRPVCEGATWNEVTEYRKQRILDENGNIIIRETPLIRGFWTIEINSIEDLVKLSKKLDEDLVLIPGENLNEIEIYDTYRE